ncbi:MAG TPA: tetratricopeptide repeat protein [Candidatus Hydrogenedentes bacterium]|nr:tetratricopeptide repeat protein [Candidatus Hydrogenedentota bacterium]
MFKGLNLDVGRLSRLGETSGSAPGEGSNGRGLRTIMHLLIILLAVAAVFAQTAGFDFIKFDDGRMVYENQRILSGINLDSVWGAFTKELPAMWIPVTILSYLVDAELFGSWAGGYHLSNVFYHILAAMALYAALCALTGHAGRSLFVALLFAIHPLRAESVAWISERKDILCGLFWFLTLWAYAGYVRQRITRRYAWVFLFMALALMSKSMAVTLPCTLLLLDWWPLRRLGGVSLFSRAAFRQMGGLLSEKAPLFFLALAGSLLTVLTQHAANAMASMEKIDLSLRAEVTVVAYLRYLVHFFCPVRLSVFYPFPDEGYPALWVVAALVVLSGFSLVCLIFYRARFLATGWLWFLGTLVPVIGLVQVGSAGMADRYMYVPGIGLSLILAWSIPEAFMRRHRGKVRALAGAIVVVLSIQAWCEVGYYRNTEILFSRAMKVTKNNYVAYEKIGEINMDRGNLDEAFRLYNLAYEVYPRSAESNYNLGSVLIRRGDYALAAGILRKAVRVDPSHGLAQTNLGVALLQLKRLDEAMPHLAEGVRLLPENVNAHINYGVGLLRQDNAEAAAREFEEALRLEPDNKAARTNYDLARKALERKKKADGGGATP